MKPIKLVFVALFSCLITSIAFAQSTFKLKQEETNEYGNVLFANVETSLNNGKVQDNEIALLKQATKTTLTLNFQKLKVETDNIGITHSFYEIYYEKLKLEGASYVISTGQKGIYAINGFYAPIENTSTTPSVVLKVAQSKAVSYLTEKLISTKRLKGNMRIFITNNALVFAFAQYSSVKKYKLAYKIKVQSQDSMYAENVYIDARNNEIINSENLICTNNAVGSGQTTYSGTRTITTDDFNTGSMFRLREVRNGVNIRTLNIQNQTEVSGAVDFIDNDNNWTAAEHGNNRPALDAHWGAEMVFDYWRTVHNRNSLNNAGIDIISYVHYGSSVDNAFWNGSSMQYGDGASLFSPLTSLDVCGHEFGHGICQYTSNLVYSGESGALNEGFSDIWGASIEAWAAPNKQRWLIGEEITLVSPNYLRSMSNPNSGLFSQPDTYNGTFWANTSSPTDNGGVHTNSGVLNYWYFLVSDGGSGTNDNSNSFSVTGVGIDHASRIAYLTEQRLNSSANFATTRGVSIQAAKDLYGECSNEVIAVTNAWFAAGIGSSFSPPTLQVSVTQIDCDNATITTNFPSGSTLNWQVNGNLLIDGVSTTKTTTSNTINVTGTEGSVYVTTTTNCGTLQAGAGYAPFQRQITGLYPEYVCGDQVSVSVNTTPYDTYYRWYINNTLVSQSSYGYSFCTCYYEMQDARVPGDNTIRVEIETSCGSTSVSNEEHFFRICNGYRVQSNVELFPNPARDQVTLRLKQINDNKLTGQLKDIREVKILDKLGNLKKVLRYSSNTKSVSVNVSNLLLDLYYVEVSDGINKSRIQLSIQK